MKTGGSIKSFLVKTIVLMFFHAVFLSGALPGIEKYLQVGIGTGWKNNVNPVYSFSSASEIFKRGGNEGGAIFLFNSEGGLHTSRERGFSIDASIGGELSLMSMENSKLDSMIAGGYFFPFNENNLMRFSLSFHNATVNFIDPESLYIDTTFSVAHIYYSDNIYSLFFRLSTSWYKSTGDLLKYLNGFFSSFESSGRIFISEHFYIEGLAAFSISFFDDQIVEYHRHHDVYYGQLVIDGRFYSLSKGLTTGFDIGDFSFPVTFRYFYSRSFSSDTHRILYWSDVEKKAVVHKKTRVDNTIEMNIGANYNITENIRAGVSYLAHRNFSNVGEDYADYGDYSRTIHSIMAEISYEF